MNDLPDNQLVALTLYGDARAFEVIVRRYQKLVYNVGYSILQDHGKSADCTQETFLRAYKSMPTFRTELRLQPWLLRIATNLALNMVRDDKFKYSASLEALLEESPQAEPPARESVEAEVEQKLLLADISDALKELPARQRHVFLLRFQHDLSYADIATVTGETEGVIKSVLFRTKEKLRKMLYDVVRVEGGG